MGVGIVRPAEELQQARVFLKMLFPRGLWPLAFVAGGCGTLLCTGRRLARNAGEHALLLSLPTVLEQKSSWALALVPWLSLEVFMFYSFSSCLRCGLEGQTQNGFVAEVLAKCCELLPPKRHSSGFDGLHMLIAHGWKRHKSPTSDRPQDRPESATLLSTLGEPLGSSVDFVSPHSRFLKRLQFVQRGP